MKKLIFKQVALGSMMFLAAGMAVADQPGAYVGVTTGLVVNTDDSGNSYRGIPLGVSLGYGGLMDPSFYLAGELFWRFGTAPLNNNGLKTGKAWGLSLIPGVMLGENVMGFARVGGVSNLFQNDYKTGAEVGLGIQTALTREWDLRGEYDYIKYKEANKTDQIILSFIYKLM